MKTDPCTEYAQSLRSILALIVDEDAARLVPELLTFAEIVDTGWSGEAREILRALHGAGDLFRITVVHDLTYRYRDLPRGTAAWRSIVQLLHNLQNGAETDRPQLDTQTKLLSLAAQEVYLDTRWLACTAEFELDEGRELRERWSHWSAARA